MEQTRRRAGASEGMQSGAVPGMPYVTALSEPLLTLPQGQPFTLDHACQGVQIFGGTGAGKTSGSGKALAQAFLRAGFGGLVLCAKTDEAENWARYAEACGRGDDLVLFNAEHGAGFNFLDYEMATAKTTQNVVHVLMNVIKAGQNRAMAGTSDPFWDNTVEELLGNCIDALYAAYGAVRLQDVFAMVHTAARSPKEGYDPKWREKSFNFQTIMRAAGDPAVPIDKEDLDAIGDYFGYNWANLSERTRSNVVATFSSMVSRFRRGALREMFTKDTTMVPEFSHEGAILVIDLPIKAWGQDGIIAAHIWKYAWQRATERRATGPGTRPVFLWADESQFFVSEYDAEFQSTARSSRTSTVYLTQNINAYEHAIGGTTAHATVRAFLGNLRTQIFHQNTNLDTNQYAAELVGRQMHWRQSVSDGFSNGRTWSQTAGRGESIQRGQSQNVGSSWNEGLNSSASHTRTGGPGGGSESTSYSSGSNASQGATTSRGSSWSQGASRQASVSSGKNTGTSHNESWQEQKDFVLEPDFFRTRLRTGGRQCAGIVDAVLVGPNLPQYLLCSFRQ